MASGEGWNGEYPFERDSKDPNDNPATNANPGGKDWRKQRDKAIKPLLPKKRMKP
jgi:hypothetical protein